MFNLFSPQTFTTTQPLNNLNKLNTCVYYKLVCYFILMNLIIKIETIYNILCT